MTIKNNKTLFEPIATSCHHADEDDCIEAEKAASNWWSYPSKNGSGTENHYAIATAKLCSQKVSPLDNNIVGDGNPQKQVCRAPIIPKDEEGESYFKPQGIVEKPSNISIQYRYDSSTDPAIKIIRQKWSVGCAMPCCVFGFDILVIFWNALLFASRDDDGPPMSTLVFSIVVSIYTAFAAFLTFLVVRQMVNSTYITLDESHIHVNHRPIHIFAADSIKFPVERVDEILCKRCVKLATQQKRPMIQFEVHLIEKEINDNDKEGQPKTVRICSVRTMEEALFIVQEMESHSSIMGNNKIYPQKSKV